MEYIAFVHREGRRWLAEFPDCPGCQTFADTKGALVEEAEEALDGWLEAHFVVGKAPPLPRPIHDVPKGYSVMSVRPRLSPPMMIRWARLLANLTRQQLADRLKVSRQQVAKLEAAGANPEAKTLMKVSAATNHRLGFEFYPRKRSRDRDSVAP